MATALPEVSLISSWYIPAGGHSEPDQPLPALRHALKQRVGLLDLYFLDRADIPWYRKACGLSKRTSTPTALDLAAVLEKKHLEEIRRRLTADLTEEYEGSLVGPRPRFAALATYWPLISLPDDEDETSREYWKKSIRAVQSSLYLAAELGCHCVEIVGGSAVPEGNKAKECHLDPHRYRDLRLNRLADGLREVFENADAQRLLKGLQDENRMPYLALEVEPGASYLINRISEYQKLRSLLKARGSQAAKWALLNLDVAHQKLIEDDAKEPDDTNIAKGLIDGRPLEDEIAHMHLSDHARTHASDLAPGAYNFYHDYLDWLILATKLRNKQGTIFSGVIAIELEACNDIHEAVRAVGRVRRWLEKVGRDHYSSSKQPDLSSGAILVVDIGNSTSHFLAQNGGELGLEKTVDGICRAVHNNRGSVLSFTGDGVIAFFDGKHYLGGAKEAAQHAQEAAEAMGEPLKDVEGITLRAALHSGHVYIPAAGRLRHQAIGSDVVLATRLCDWIGKTIEPSVPKEARGSIMAVTEDFWRNLKNSPRGRQRFGQWGIVECHWIKLPGSRIVLFCTPIAV